MGAFGILIVFLGLWVIINGLNGNLPGLVTGETQLNLPNNNITSSNPLGYEPPVNSSALDAGTALPSQVIASMNTPIKGAGGVR